MNLKLKFRIIEKYRTQAVFAKACGRTDNWISRIITGRDIVTEEDRDLICLKLRIDDPDEYFPENIKLRDRIIEKYRTEGKFTAACGRRYDWLYHILRRGHISEEDKKLICVKLQIENPAEFFPE